MEYLMVIRQKMPVIAIMVYLNPIYKCGPIKYGSNEDRRNWFICPKIWCPCCKISIREDKIVMKNDVLIAIV